MLCGGDAGGSRDDGIAGGMDAPCPIGRNPNVAHRAEPFDDPLQVGGRWCFRPFAYPPESGAAVVVGGDQMFERGFLLGRTVADQVCMGCLARPCPHNEREPFQRRCRRQHDPIRPKAIDHPGGYRFAPIGRGGDLRSQRQHGVGHVLARQQPTPGMA